MPPASTSPLEGTDRVIIDGSNLLHRMGADARVAPAAPGAAPVMPPSALIGRIRGVVPATITVELVLDGLGHGIFGRLAQKMMVKWSGRRTADEVILDLVSEAAMHGPGTLAVSKVLVVTDDRELRALVTVKGARTASSSWLLGRLQVPAVAAPATGRRRPTLGSGRPPGGPGGQGGPGGKDQDDASRGPGWKPGRGATAKTGVARRVARHKRHPGNG